MIAIIVYTITGIYLLMVILFTIGWLKTPTFKPNKSLENPLVSLVVCCKNEAQNLPHLLQSIEQQTARKFEVIFANDHSTDETPEILTNFCAKNPHAKLIHTTKHGKKNALREAILHANSDVIVCSDADCVLTPNHLEILANYFAQHNPDLLLGGVKMNYNHTLFQQLQALEFASLIASAAGACGLGSPIMSNGANMAFTKAIWEKYNHELHDEELSGDDMFLMMAVKKNNGHIAFIKNPDAVVETGPQTTLKKFLNQRMRWTSKTKSYTDWQTIFVATLIFTISILFLALFMGGFWDKTLFNTLVIAFVAKWLSDTAFLTLFLPFYNQRRLIPYTLALSVVYPIYIVYSASAGLFGKFRWKQA